MKNTPATLEWHWYCPYCERSCHSRFNGTFCEFKIICSDCDKDYKVTLPKNSVDMPDRKASV